MIEFEIPNRGHYTIHHVVFDVNGTLATDGNMTDDVPQLIQALREYVDVHLLTADTHGKQHFIDEQLGMKAHIIMHGAEEKAGIVREIGGDVVVAIGNGTNDVPMMEEACLSIAVLGREGLSTQALRVADVLVQDVRDAINMLLNPDRLRATLRR